MPHTKYKSGQKKEKLQSTFFIPEHVPSSKNSRIRTKHGAFVVSKATRTWRKNTAKYWEADRDRFIALTCDNPKPLRIGFHFIRKTKHKYDWPNPLQTILDEMVRHSWIEDDNIQEIVPIPLKWKGEFTTVDSSSPGVIIKILN